jgi:hypothetical protein
MPTTPENATDATPLGEALATYEAEGYTGQLGAADGGLVICYTCHQTSAPGDVALRALTRTEGASDPDDMVAVAAVTCPRCDTKGTLVLHYGATASTEEDDVLRALEDLRSRDGGTDALT